MPKRHNGIPLFLAILVMVAFAFLNLDGYQIHLAAHYGTPQGFWGVGNFSGEPPLNNWVHGWPIGFGVRICFKKVNTGQIQNTSRWPFDGVAFSYFNWVVLIADCAIAAIIVLGSFVGSRMVCGRVGWNLRYNLKTMFVVMTVCAIVAASYDRIFVSRYPLQLFMVGIVVFGCILSAISLVGAMVRCVRSEYRTTEM